MTNESSKKGRPKGAGNFTRAEDDQIIRGLQAGFTATQVAKMLGRGRATVFKRLVAMRAQPLLPLHGDAQ